MQTRLRERTPRDDLSGGYHKQDATSARVLKCVLAFIDETPGFMRCSFSADETILTRRAFFLVVYCGPP